MYERYDHWTLRADGPHLELGREAKAALEAAGGVVVGAWSGAGSIGWWDEELTVLVAWPDEPPELGGVAANGHPALLGDRLSLVATVRPTEVEPLTPGGVFAQRWFEIDPTDWEEFVDLSERSWPAFEAAFDAQIHGFFRAAHGGDGTDQVLLLTRYPTLEAWERSRGVLRNAGDDAAAAEAGRNFLRRRLITKRSVVRIASLLVL